MWEGISRTPRRNYSSGAEEGLHIRPPVAFSLRTDPKSDLETTHRDPQTWTLVCPPLKLTQRSTCGALEALIDEGLNSLHQPFHSVISKRLSQLERMKGIQSRHLACRGASVRLTKRRRRPIQRKRDRLAGVIRILSNLRLQCHVSNLRRTRRSVNRRRVCCGPYRLGHALPGPG